MVSKKQLTLSLIIPAYNEEHHLKACLDAVAAQSVMPDEVIVVDNNSTDKTRLIAQEYSFVTLVNEPKQGVVFARNCGFNAAKSSLIGRIDADTILSPDWVARTTQYLARHTTVSAVSGSCIFYDFPLPRITHAVHWLFYYKLHALIAGTTILWGSNMALRQESWQQCRNSLHTDSGMHEDIDLALNLQKAGLGIEYVPELQAQVSMRRGRFSLKRDYLYLSAWPRTYQLNGLRLKAAIIEVLKWVIIILLAVPALFLSNFRVDHKSN